MKANLNLQFAGQKYLAGGLTGVLLAATLAAQVAGVVAHDAWARVPAPSKTETALYMVVENHSNQARSIVSVSSAASEKAEMHEMKMMPAK